MCDKIQSINKIVQNAQSEYLLLVCCECVRVNNFFFVFDTSGDKVKQKRNDIDFLEFRRINFNSTHAKIHGFWKRREKKNTHTHFFLAEKYNK